MQPETERRVIAVSRVVAHTVDELVALLRLDLWQGVVIERVDVGTLDAAAAFPDRQLAEALKEGVNLYASWGEATRAEKDGFVADGNGQAPLFLRVWGAQVEDTLRLCLLDSGGEVVVDAPLVPIRGVSFVTMEVPTGARRDAFPGDIIEAIEHRLAQ